MANHADGNGDDDVTGSTSASGADWRDEAESALADVTGALHAAWDGSRQARVEALEAARGALLHLGAAVDQAASAARAAWDDRDDDEAAASPTNVSDTSSEETPVEETP